MRETGTGQQVAQLHDRYMMMMIMIMMIMIMIIIIIIIIITIIITTTSRFLFAVPTACQHLFHK
jgi:hypothetical protein